MKLNQEFDQDRGLVAMVTLDHELSNQEEKLAEPLLSDKNNSEVRTFQQINSQFPPRKIVLLNQSILVEPTNKQINIIRNQKYSIITFIPLVLFHQFKYFFNFFYLAIAISQFIPPLQVGLLFSYVAPLALVLFLTMLKQAYDDICRYRKDQQANSTKYKVIKKTGIIELKSKQLKVGDIVEVNSNQRMPADIIILSTSEPSGTVFIRTDQLDGQTDWKLRKPSKLIQQFTNKHPMENILFEEMEINSNQFLLVVEPIVNIYKFSSTIIFDKQKEGLDLENAAWAGTVLASGKIWGIVAYAGKQMRVALNSRQPRTKFGQLDKQLNKLSKLLFLSMLLIALILVLLKGFTLSMIGYQFLLLFRYLLLLSSIIPISMRVNLDFAKLMYSYKINKDQEIAGTQVRNSNIPQQLGRIQFLLSDKTGTLTQNQMVFKKMSLQNICYSVDQFLILKDSVHLQANKMLGPLSDIHEKYLLENKKKAFRRTNEKILLDMVYALAICHNVTPVIDDYGNRILQASSPDEVALVKMSESLDIILKSRTQDSIVLEMPNKQEQKFKILSIFPFSSQTKRMGIIVKHIQTDRIILYLKGADSQMKHRMSQNQRGFMLDQCEELARQGLRTMVISQKYLTKQQYQEFRQQEKQVKSQLRNREDLEKQLREKLESSVEFLGVTGVEDKLQIDVHDTLESLRNAGISVWMLTGDKIQTAKCIAISTGIKAVTHQLSVIKEIETAQDLRVQLQQFKKTNNNILIIDGITLKIALEDLKNYFFDIACNAPAVICARTSPTQKAQVVQAIKTITGKKTCAIGDGGNDVGMIQAADVGIGIQGKQGIQAALASDFSLKQFKQMKKLFLWHGRLSYKRSCILSQFIIHRGMIITVMQAIFIVCFYFIALPLYNGVLMLGYSTLFTNLPVFSLIFDQDIDEQTALAYPELYKSLQKGRQLNTKTFLGWVWVSIFQGFLIISMAFLFFENDSFYLLSAITFSALIVIQFLNIFTSIHKLHVIMIVSIVLSMAVYILTLFLMKDYLNVNRMDGIFWLKILGMSLITWLPPFCYKLIFTILNPSDYDKVMKNKNKK